MMPLRMASAVLVPITWSGIERPTCESRAPRLKRLSAPLRRPGAMMPPRKAPVSSITSMFVAVPRSTTTTGAP